MSDKAKSSCVGTKTPEWSPPHSGIWEQPPTEIYSIHSTYKTGSTLLSRRDSSQGFTHRIQRTWMGIKITHYLHQPLSWHLAFACPEHREQTVVSTVPAAVTSRITGTFIYHVTVVANLKISFTFITMSKLQ